MSMSKLSDRKKFILCFAVVFSLLFLGWENPIVKKTLVLATTVQSEPVTELYFENHSQIPENIKRNIPYDVAFTIHNLENQDMHYTYEVFINTNTQKQMIASNAILVKKDTSRTIHERVTFTQFFIQSEVVVNLINKNQQINFWVNGNPPVPTSTATVRFIPKSTPDPKKYGEWYWQPTLQKAQLWLGKDKAGNDNWAEAFPTKTPVK